MAYRMVTNLALGLSQTGLTLKAQLVDTDGNDVGSEVTTGFVERGLGNYMWDYAAFPDGFTGGVDFYTGAHLAANIKAFLAVNPGDLELVSSRLDAAVSSRPTAAQVDSQLTASHGAGAWTGSGGGSDPLEAEVPGDYDPGTAGYVLGQLAGSPAVSSVAPVLTSAGDLELVKGSDYTSAHGNQITFTNEDVWPDLSNAHVFFSAFGGEDIDMDVSQGGGATQVVSLELQDTATADLPLNRYRYTVTATLTSGDRVVLARGRVLFS